MVDRAQLPGAVALVAPLILLKSHMLFNRVRRLLLQDPVQHPKVLAMEPLKVVGPLLLHHLDMVEAWPSRDTSVLDVLVPGHVKYLF